MVFNLDNLTYYLKLIFLIRAIPFMLRIKAIRKHITNENVVLQEMKSPKLKPRQIIVLNIQLHCDVSCLINILQLTTAVATWNN